MTEISIDPWSQQKGDVFISLDPEVYNRIIVDRAEPAVPEPDAYLAQVRGSGGGSLLVRSEKGVGGRTGGKWKVFRVKGDRRIEKDPEDALSWAEIVKHLGIHTVTGSYQERSDW
jgi:hypothetical protein